MSLWEMVRGEFVDIIEWLDDTNTTLAWRFPRYRNEIKNGAELIVREGQRAVFVYRGEFADEYGPGHYTLTSENMPVMSTLQGWKHGFASPFRSEVYFVNTRPYPDLRWGTPQPITLRDPDFTLVQLRANGTAIVRVIDPVVFLRQVIGTESTVDTDQITQLIRSAVALGFTDMVTTSGLGAIELQGRQVALSDRLREFVAKRVHSVGLGIDAVTMTVSLPEELQQAITSGVARGVAEAGFLNNVGDLNRYAQGRAADAMLAAAQSEGGGVAGAAVQAALGMMVGAKLPGSASAAAPPPLPSDQLFHVEQAGQAAGPYPIEGLRQLIADGRLTAATNVWTPGMAAWAAASAVPALQELFATPPPLPGNTGQH